MKVSDLIGYLYVGVALYYAYDVYTTFVYNYKKQKSLGSDLTFASFIVTFLQHTSEKSNTVDITFKLWLTIIGFFLFRWLSSEGKNFNIEKLLISPLDIMPVLITCFIGNDSINLYFSFLYLYLIAKYFADKISQLSIKLKLPTPIQHVKLFAVSLLLIFISFAVFCSYHFDPVYIPLMVMCFKVLALHVVFLNDYEAQGNSKESMVKQQILNITTNLSLLVTFVFMNVIPFIRGRKNEIILERGIHIFAVAFTSIKEFYDSRTISRQIDDLPTVEPEDETDLCIICRMEFSKAPVKKLPCGHYYHAECISKWVISHRKCPICNQKIDCSKDGHHHDHEHQQNFPIFDVFNQ